MTDPRYPDPELFPLLARDLAAARARRRRAARRARLAVVLVLLALFAVVIGFAAGSVVA